MTITKTEADVLQEYARILQKQRDAAQDMTDSWHEKLEFAKAEAWNDAAEFAANMYRTQLERVRQIKRREAVLLALMEREYKKE